MKGSSESIEARIDIRELGKERPRIRTQRVKEETVADDDEELPRTKSVQR
jgi:hypothetical protein